MRWRLRWKDLVFVFWEQSPLRQSTSRAGHPFSQGHYWLLPYLTDGRKCQIGEGEEVDEQRPGRYWSSQIHLDLGLRVMREGRPNLFATKYLK